MQAHGTSISQVSSFSAVLNDSYPLHTCALLALEHLLQTALSIVFLHTTEKISEKKNGHPQKP